MGIQSLNLGGTSRIFKNHQGNTIKIQSLESYNFLRLIPGNHILFECQDANIKTIAITQE